MLTANNVRITADTSQAAAAIGKVNLAWTEMRSKIELVAMGARSLVGIAQGVASIGAKIDQVNQSAALNKYGLGKGMLAALRQETGDIVDQLTLATESARLMRSGVVQSVAEISDAYRWAITRGREVGVEADAAIKAITDSLIKGSAEPLQRLGVIAEAAGDHLEKSADILARVRKEVQLFSSDFQISAEGYGERVQAAKNALLDMVEGFSALRGGFELTKSLISFVAEKTKRSAEEIWQGIEESAAEGVKRLQRDIDSAARVLIAARASGDAAAAEAAQARLEKLREDARTFVAQYRDLYEKIGKPSGARGLGSIVEAEQAAEVVSGIAQNMTVSEEAAESMLRRLAAGKVDVGYLRRDAEGYARSLFDANEAMAEAGRRAAAARVQGERGESALKAAVADLVQAQDRAVKFALEGAKASRDYALAQKGVRGAAAELNALLEKRAKALAEEASKAKKLVEDRKALGVLVRGDLDTETRAASLKKEYLAILDKQLTIAESLGDPAAKAAIEAQKEAVAKATTLDAVLALLDAEKKKEKKHAEQKDADRERLKALRMQAAAYREVGAEIDENTKREVENLEKIVRLHGEARERMRARLDAEKALAEQRAARLDAITAEGEAERREKEASDKQLGDILDRRRQELQLYGQEANREVKTLLEQFENAKKAGVEGFGAAMDALQKLEALEPTLERLKRVSDALQAASAAAAKAREEALYAQHAPGGLKADAARLELALKDAILKKDVERAEALQREIEALYRKADAEGRAMYALELHLQKYQEMQKVASAAGNALAQAAWAENEVVKQYGSRAKYAQALFAQQMRQLAVSETVEALKAAAQALAASVYAPAAAPALWASAATHAAAAAATGMIGKALDVGKKGGGGAAEKAAQSTPPSGSGSGEQKIEVNVTLSGKAGWEGALVEAIYDAQRRGKARRWGA